MRDCTRRRALCASGIALLGALAGCSGRLSGSLTPEKQSYDHLDVTSVYVAEGIDLSLPQNVPSVDQPYNAELLVLPGDTDADAEQVVEWFADDRILALLGNNSQETWTTWVRSNSFDDHFKNEGYAEAEPAPSLVVGTTFELHLTTYRHSLGEQPSDREVLGALDEALVTINKETSSN